MATEIQFQLLQVSAAYENGTLKSTYQQAGNIVFDKTTHTITICKDTSAANNWIYAGGLKTASFNTTDGLTIEDYNGDSITLSKDNIIALLGDTYTTPEQVYTLITNGFYNKTQVDNKLSDKANKSDVYTKSEIDTSLATKADKTTTYTKTEVDGFLDDKADADELETLKETVSGIPKFDIEVVDTLPTTGNESTIYLVKDKTGEGDLYTEYIYVNNKWENLGRQTVDLSGYLPLSGGTMTGNLVMAATAFIQANMIAPIGATSSTAKGSVGGINSPFFEAYINTLHGTADKAKALTEDAKPVFGTDGAQNPTKINVTVGGQKSDDFEVPYANQAYMATNGVVIGDEIESLWTDVNNLKQSLYWKQLD